MSTSMSARLSKSTKQSKAASTAKESKMAKSTAKSRTIVFTLQGDNYASHYLAVRVEPEFRLNDQEKAALLEIFDVTPGGQERHNFNFKLWLPGVKEQMKGYAFYWLCDAKLAKLGEVKEMVAEALQPAKPARKTAQQPQGDAVRGKAASKADKAKDAAKNKAKARQATPTLVLG